MTSGNDRYMCTCGIILKDGKYSRNPKTEQRKNETLRSNGHFQAERLKQMKPD